MASMDDPNQGDEKFCEVLTDKITTRSLEIYETGVTVASTAGNVALRVSSGCSIFGNNSGNGINSANGMLQVNSINSNAMVDGACFRPCTNNNHIINFVSAGNSLRGKIKGNGSNNIQYQTSSDRRLKSDIVDVPSYWELVKNLNTRSFKWKDCGLEAVGFIAQEVFAQPEMKELKNGPFELLDASDGVAMRSICEKYSVHTMYHLVAMLSATGEKFPMKAWDLNMQSLLHALELAREGVLSKIFWPSSIAVFGPTTPHKNTPQQTIMEPSTVYGISKLAGERWCEYYASKYGVDVRSIRYPGLISWKSQPGGGTTDYAVDIYYKAIEEGRYTCFLSEHRALPMMYMDDAIRATIELTEAPDEKVKIRSSYNLAGISFDPVTIAASVAKYVDGFTMDCKADFREEIAASWPESIDDSAAREDWNWSPTFDLDAMTQSMLSNLKVKLGK
jgi:nucleoside-diphosphate-sugar epimerase